jgi:hypothetical protein
MGKAMMETSLSWKEETLWLLELISVEHFTTLKLQKMVILYAAKSPPPPFPAQNEWIKNIKKYSQITHQINAPYFHFLFFNPYICFSLYKAIFRGLVIYIYFTSIVYVSIMLCITYSQVFLSFIDYSYLQFLYLNI